MDTQNKYIVIGATRTGINLIKKLHALAFPAFINLRVRLMGVDDPRAKAPATMQE